MRYSYIIILLHAIPLAASWDGHSSALAEFAEPIAPHRGPTLERLKELVEKYGIKRTETSRYVAYNTFDITVYWRKDHKRFVMETGDPRFPIEHGPLGSETMYRELEYLYWRKQVVDACTDDQKPRIDPLD